MSPNQPMTDTPTSNAAEGLETETPDQRLERIVNDLFPTYPTHPAPFTIHGLYNVGLIQSMLKDSESDDVLILNTIGDGVAYDILTKVLGGRAFPTDPGELSWLKDQVRTIFFCDYCCEFEDDEYEKLFDEIVAVYKSKHTVPAQTATFKDKVMKVWGVAKKNTPRVAPFILSFMGGVAQRDNTDQVTTHQVPTTSSVPTSINATIPSPTVTDFGIVVNGFNFGPDLHNVTGFFTRGNAVIVQAYTVDGKPHYFVSDKKCDPGAGTTCESSFTYKGDTQDELYSQYAVPLQDNPLSGQLHIQDGRYKTTELFEKYVSDNKCERAKRGTHENAALYCKENNKIISIPKKTSNVIIYSQ